MSDSNIILDIPKTDSIIDITNSIIDNTYKNDFFDTDNNPWDKSEKYAISIVICNLFIILLLSLIGHIFNIKEIEIDFNYDILFQFFKITIIFFLFFLGIIRNLFEIEVQYTRKTLHIISLLVLPYISYKNYENRKTRSSDNNMNLLYYSFYQCLWSSFFLGALIIILCKPIRKLNNCIGYISKISFLSINRYEDRPNTLLWFLSQMTSVNLIVTPMTIWFAHNNIFHLFWIPVFASGLGDGLAEIVGKKCGKHKYNVYALFSDTIYTRSLEGSFCVWLFTFIGIAIGYSYYSSILKFIMTILILPILTTLVEAFSPHTWDNHFIFGIIWLFLWIIFDIW